MHGWCLKSAQTGSSLISDLNPPPPQKCGRRWGRQQSLRSDVISGFSFVAPSWFPDLLTRMAALPGKSFPDNGPETRPLTGVAMPGLPSLPTAGPIPPLSSVSSSLQTSLLVFLSILGRPHSRLVPYHVSVQGPRSPS